MKKALLSLFMTAAIGLTTMAQELPVPSPRATFKQRVGVTDVTIDYSRPGVKERKIFGELVPYGELWRTGANAATTIEFSSPVEIRGKQVPAGKYSMFTLPNKNAWVIILNKNTDQAGTGDYSKDMDIARFKVKPRNIKPRRESLLIYVDNIRNSSANLALEWSDLMLSLPFKVNTDEMAVANIKKALSGKRASSDTYNDAASYYLENGKSAKTALKWARQSVKMNKKFYNTYTLSKALHETGNVKEAMKMAKTSMRLAQKADYDFYVNQNKKNMKKWKKGM